MPAARVKILLFAALVALLPACKTAEEKPHVARRETADPLLTSYILRVKEAVGKAWYTQMRFHMSLLTPGVLKMSFVVKPDGRVARVQVVSNTSNESFAAASTTALMEAKIPPIPLNVLATTKGGGIAMDYTFSLD